MSDVYEPNDSGQDINEGGTLSRPVTYIKALLAGGIAFSGGMVTATATEGITQAEMWVVIATTLAALGIVYQVPNAGRS